MATVQPVDGARDSSVEATEGAPMMGGAEPEALAAAAAKTCLPQRTLCPLPNKFGGWKEGFETYHIALFLVGLIFGNIALLATGAVDRPTAGCAAVNATAGCAAAALPVQELLQPSNPTMKLFLLTTVALFAKCHLMTWLEVWMGCKNNSFSKNVWDENTGNTKVQARKTEQDLFKQTCHNIHANDIENIPLTLALHTLLVLVQPTLTVARLVFITYTVSRFVHTCWYAGYGSHEIRAMIFALNCFSNYMAAVQILAAVDVL